jgi:MFS family permease
VNGLGVAFLLSLGTVVSNSFARFAYALMLPAMRNALGWNWSQAGWLNTANAFGYLAGALLARSLVDRVGNRALFIAGMPATALALLATGLCDDLLALSVLRAIAGVAGAMVFVCGGALAGNVFPDDPRRATLAITVFFGGSGAGLVLCGAGIPLLLERGGDAAWPQAWLAMGAASLAMTVAAVAAARAIVEPAAIGARRPAQGAAPVAASTAVTAASAPAPAPAPAPARCARCTAWPACSATKSTCSVGCAAPPKPPARACSIPPTRPRRCAWR